MGQAILIAENPGDLVPQMFTSLHPKCVYNFAEMVALLVCFNLQYSFYCNQS